GYTLPVIPRPAPIRQQLEGWMDSLRLRNLLSWHSEEEEGETLRSLEYQPDNESAVDAVERRSEDEDRPVRADLPVGTASIVELINLSFETMQTSLTRYKIAGYPPDVVVDVPKR